MKRQTTAVGFLVLAVLFSAGCSTAPSKKSGQPPDQPYYEHSRMMIDDVDAPLDINDPWEGMNRPIYRFNSTDANARGSSCTPFDAGHRFRADRERLHCEPRTDRKSVV